MCGHGWLFIKKTETVSFQLPVTSQCTHLYWGHLCFVLELQSKEGSSTCFFRPLSSYHCGQKVLDHFFYFSSVTHCIPCGPKWKQNPLPFPSHTPWKHYLTHHPPSYPLRPTLTTDPGQTIWALNEHRQAVLLLTAVLLASTTTRYLGGLFTSRYFFFTKQKWGY